jgi:ADP-heptose:LPS heptosyltransferase
MKKSVLKKFGLKPDSFIVLNRSVDSSNKSTESTKLWPSLYYVKLVNKIKENNNINIIAVGPKNGSEVYLGNVIDLRGKTSFNELKALLKNARLLISSEGGMVHLRHAMNQKVSCVLFGPTSLPFFGYKENINITSEVCPLDHCEWVIEDWQTRCLRTDCSYCSKLQDISPDQVYEKIKYLL